MAGEPAPMVTEEQSPGLGGADKKTGAHGKDTHQQSDERQIVVIARFKPAESVFSQSGMASASGLIGSVTGAAEKAVSAVESVMASIPGIQMFIKEDKKDSSSEKAYKYDYSEWNSKTPGIDKNIKKIFSENEVAPVFEFDAVDIDGRKEAAKKLYNEKLKSSLSKWSKYKVRIHLVGIGQGGNVMNELTQLLSKDSQYNSEDWFVKSVFYVSTPVYSDFHKLDEECLKSQGEVIHFNSSLDLTQRVIAYFSPAEDFLKFIENCNSNTLSLAVGKIKLTIVKILSLFLGNTSIGPGNTGGLDKFGQIKPEIENLVNQMTGMVKQIASEISSFIDPGKLPEFGEALNGLDDIPKQSMDAFGTFISNLGDTIKNQGKSIVSGGGSLGPQNLMGVFNCLCPLLEQITKAISVLDYESPATVALANQMIENAGITELYGKGQTEGNSVELNSVSAEYQKERLKIYKDEGKIDKINKLIDDASELLLDIKNGKEDIKALNNEKKIQLAGALYSIIQPMLISKKRVLEELQKWIAKLDIEALLKDISANKLLGMANPLLDKLQLKFDKPLNDSIGHADSQLNRLKDFFKPHEYDLHKDTLFYIYNIHNTVVNSFFDDIQYNLDKQTGFIEYMHNRGSENQFLTSNRNTYMPEGEKNSDNTIVTNKVPETANA